MSLIGSEIRHDAAFKKNEEHLKALLHRFQTAARTVKLGGGAGAIAKHRQRNKLTARERIEKLIDPKTEFLEIGLFTAHGMYKEYGGAPSAGVVCGIGKIEGRDVVIVANDATVK
ncbi:MAG: acyl-CoA carboxylase subunit beta, partial [Bacteroidota bacterium]|nr:acyl-CoA carboxylase subunit beta [Bacteroidota bacterium]